MDNKLFREYMAKRENMKRTAQAALTLVRQNRFFSKRHGLK